MAKSSHDRAWKMGPKKTFNSLGILGNKYQCWQHCWVPHMYWICDGFGLSLGGWHVHCSFIFFYFRNTHLIENTINLNHKKGQIIDVWRRKKTIRVIGEKGQRTHRSGRCLPWAFDSPHNHSLFTCEICHLRDPSLGIVFLYFSCQCISTILDWNSMKLPFQLHMI